MVIFINNYLYFTNLINTMSAFYTFKFIYIYLLIIIFHNFVFNIIYLDSLKLLASCKQNTKFQYTCLSFSSSISYLNS